jgi:DNA mismatch endonuclease (patch repair protein)
MRNPLLEPQSGGTRAMDTLSKPERSRRMALIRSKNSKLELAFGQALEALCKETFERHPKDIIGVPDFALRKRKVAIFLDGCFWHGCPIHYRSPKTNKRYWQRKLRTNVARDIEISEELFSQGWRVLRIWEHSFKKSTMVKDAYAKVLNIIAT